MDRSLDWLKQAQRELEQARELFDKIAQHAWKTGEPGVLFVDTANKANTVPHLGEFKATNPCAEIWLLDHEVCNLGSINLDRMIIEACLL